MFCPNALAAHLPSTSTTDINNLSSQRERQQGRNASPAVVSDAPATDDSRRTNSRLDKRAPLVTHSGRQKHPEAGGAEGQHCSRQMKGRKWIPGMIHTPAGTPNARDFRYDIKYTVLSIRKVDMPRNCSTKQWASRRAGERSSSVCICTLECIVCPFKTKRSHLWPVLHHQEPAQW